MTTEKFFSAQERVTSEFPRIKKEAREAARANFVRQLEGARVHLRLIQTNPVAVRLTEANIAKLEQQLAAHDAVTAQLHTSTDWTDQ